MSRKSPLDAAAVVNTYDEASIADVIWRYGELKNAKILASAIVDARQYKPVETTSDLKDIVSSHLSKGSENKMLAQLFQALRIEVNREMETLEMFCRNVLKSLMLEGDLWCFRIILLKTVW